MSIKSDAIIIRDETIDFANTATRVGGNLVEIADKLITQDTEIALNTEKIGISQAQSDEIITNNDKVGITSTQAVEIIANNAKVSFNAPSSTKLNGIEDNSTADQTDFEIETAYNNQVPLMTKEEAESGTSTAVLRVTAERIKQAINALAVITTAVINDLNSVDSTKVLSANQGRILKELADTKASIESPTFTGTVSGVTKSMVGLGDSDNTSDVNKPISDATQLSLSSKAPLESPVLTGTTTIDSLVITTGIELGQEYENVLSSRSLNTEYTNTSGNNMFVAVAGNSTNFLEIYVINPITNVSILVTKSFDSISGNDSNVSAIVPPGKKYKVTIGNSSGQITNWAELS